MKIAVVGTGYVGLVAGACLAESGNDVVCVDNDDDKVRMLRRGKMPFYEPGLEELVRRNRSEGRLTFTSTLPKAVRASAVIFIAVGTPQGEDGSADVNQVLERRARHRQGDEWLQGDRRQEHGARRNERSRSRGDPARNDAPVQRRQQPGVPQAGCGGRRLHEARSRRHWRRRSEGRRNDARALQPVHAHRRAHHGDGLCKRRAVEVRCQCHAGDAHFVHERDCQCLRAGRRRHRPGPPRRRLRSPHRPLVPVSGHRLRRQLFSKGRSGADPLRRATRTTTSGSCRRSRL